MTKAEALQKLDRALVDHEERQVARMMADGVGDDDIAAAREYNKMSRAGALEAAADEMDRFLAARLPSPTRH